MLSSLVRNVVSPSVFRSQKVEQFVRQIGGDMAPTLRWKLGQPRVMPPRWVDARYGGDRFSCQSRLVVRSALRQEGLGSKDGSDWPTQVGAVCNTTRRWGGGILKCAMGVQPGRLRVGSEEAGAAVVTGHIYREEWNGQG